MADDHQGSLIRIGRQDDEHGRSVVEVVIHFYDGAFPDVGFDTVFERKPVRVIPAEMFDGR